jgi:hypothetical protein
MLPRIEQLLPAHAEAWRAAIGTMLSDLRASEPDDPA